MLLLQRLGQSGDNNKNGLKLSSVRAAQLEAAYLTWSEVSIGFHKN